MLWFKERKFAIVSELQVKYAFKNIMPLGHGENWFRDLEILIYIEGHAIKPPTGSISIGVCW